MNDNKQVEGKKTNFKKVSVRTYTWDTAGRMTQATRSSQTTSYSYNDNSWATGMDYPTGVLADYLYNANGWMTNIDVKKSDNTSILDLDYTFDNNGNITSEKVGSETWSYTYDALNRLTNVDKPGTTNDVVYTYDQRGNRTDIDIGATDNTDFTFNVADRLTRVDYESTAYELFAYDNNGNCTSKEYYSGSPFVLSPSSLPSKEKLESSRVHYPHQYAPSSLRTYDLSPYLPSSYMDTATWDIATRNNKQMEDLLRKNIWLSPSSPTVDPDYVTTYEYTYDNQLKQANLPTNSDTVTFQYDASGRRLKKTYTSHIEIDGTPHTDITTYKYHYAGGAITEIELDKVRDSTTTLLDQELIYHIGANSQLVSFEWTRHTGTGESQTTTTSTYYYHYDIHGNTLKVTDTNQDTRITYTYDTLGNITSQTNPDSIPNPFTFMGASQTILDTETNLYFSSGYYNPQTGTLLQGTGSPAMPNPTSISTINSMSTSSLPEEQLLSHSITSATTAGSSSGGEPGSFSPPAGPSDGISHSGKQSGPPSLDSMSIGGISISYSGGGNSWVNRSVLTEGSGLGNNYMPPDPPKPKKEEDADRKNPDDSDLNKWWRRSGGESGEGGGTADPTPPPAMPKMAEDNLPQVSMGWAASSNGEKYSGYLPDAADPINDKNPSDDGGDYYWVIRDANGNITACCTKAGNVYVFETNGDGTRKSNRNLVPEMTNSKYEDRLNLAKSWSNICDSVKNKSSLVAFYCDDSSGNGKYKETSGCIGMQITSGGLWVGIFQDRTGTYVKEGKASDFFNVQTKDDPQNGIFAQNPAIGSLYYAVRVNDSYNGWCTGEYIYDILDKKNSKNPRDWVVFLMKSGPSTYAATPPIWDEVNQIWNISNLKDR